MKIRILSLVLILGLVFVGCDNDDDNGIEKYNAIILKESSSCRVQVSESIYLIEFKEGVADLPVKGQRIYNAVNLPKKYRIGGLKINTTYRKLTKKEHEKFPCIVTYGPDTLAEDYPFIYIESVE